MQQLLLQVLDYLFLNEINLGPINLGNPNEMNMNELAEKIIKLTGSNSNIIFKPLPQNDPKVRKPNISRAKQLIDFNPSVNLETGLKKTIKYFSSK